MITVYGIPNCDTVKKARTWLDENGVSYVFHDFKKQGLPAATFDKWAKAAGWELLINRKGTTWRKLDPTVQGEVVDGASAKKLALDQLSVIKRPVVEWGSDFSNQITVGFDSTTWKSLIADSRS